jgi:hypothetical protein
VEETAQLMRCESGGRMPVGTLKVQRFRRLAVYP